MTSGCRLFPLISVTCDTCTHAHKDTAVGGSGGCFYPNINAFGFEAGFNYLEVKI